jgi:PhnB protein
MENTITPKLIVRGAADAITFYVEVFAAREQERHVEDGRIVNATLTLGKSSFALADEAPQWHNHAPPSLGGSPVILMLDVADPDAVCARAVARGAKVIFPVADQSYGHRAGRIQDPFGHLWILDKPL